MTNSNLARERSRCTETKKDGTPCTAPVLRAGASVCSSHDPEMADRLKASRAKGGRSKSELHRMKALMPARLIPIFEQMEDRLPDVFSGAINPRVAQALAAYIRTMAVLVQQGQVELEIADLREQIAALQAAADAAQQQQPSIRRLA
jgi:hypothetical protein